MVYPFVTKGFLGRPLRLIAVEDGGPLKGNDVIALQIAASTKARDGVFGPLTEAALRSLQQKLGVKVDGVSGPGTEQAYCMRQIGVHEAGVPHGLARGMIEGESNFRLGAQSPTYTRSGVLKADLGAVQFSTAQADEAAVLKALDADEGVARLCKHLADKRAEYFDEPFVKAHSQRVRLAGWLACGSWNAPAWTDVWARFGPDNASVQIPVTLQDGTIGTREQWIRNYVASKIGYVTDWSV
jgi:hypothetical protein